MPSYSACRAAGASQRIHDESEEMLRIFVRKFEDRIRLVRARYRIDVLGDRFSVRESVNVTPRVFRDAMDDIAVEISLAMKRKGLRLCDVRDKMRVSDKRANAISRYLRGTDHPVGIIGAFKAAEAVRIPIRILVGEEAVLNPDRPRRRRSARPVFDGQLVLPLECGL